MTCLTQACKERHSSRPCWLTKASDDVQSHIKEAHICFRLSLLVFGLLVVTPTAYAVSPCARVKAQPDVWVAAQVDALVSAARAAYESDTARPAYERVLGGIN